MNYAKSRQIASLRQMVPSAVCLQPDESRWQVQLVNQQFHTICTLQVLLPDQFPSVAPRISVTERLEHPWLNADHVTGHPALRSWNPHCHLGTVVSEIVKEFTRNPPRHTAGPATAAAAIPSRTTQPVGAASSDRSVGGVQQPPPPLYGQSVSPPGTSGPSTPSNRPRTPLPPCPAEFERVKQMSLAELEFYKDNPNCLDDLITESEQLQQYAAMTSDLIKANAEVLEKNLARQQEVEEAQKAVTEKWTALQARKAEVEGLLKEQDALMQRFNAPQMVSALAEEARADFTAAEEVKRELFSASIDLHTFKRAYLQHRKDFHRKMAKKEKLERQQQ
ncbi:unnamed protein product [Vitrella brassicaformis CCMP3155]|uniref:VPS37 C-terminal domain-containing protein n=2 Tax=Vitrella brassicaformis TaxID=1169539 RepID=A0A0G4FKW6_VITBC|nr:unnamed protein product [Vitrella brassicaformis CCMP3155]|mmetsp:Transcript_10123/g.29225  ORF Transcript_10123/g.29225 Transcript_10123/m.29225 type:complete len:335 (-) Transcript_10123:586-1590(-)|eukprot:CEM14369.1 unnamed protein product [Vitrella brassicaformis CCMP3155]